MPADVEPVSGVGLPITLQPIAGVINRQFERMVGIRAGVGVLRPAGRDATRPQQTLVARDIHARVCIPGQTAGQPGGGPVRMSNLRRRGVGPTDGAFRLIASQPTSQRPLVLTHDSSDPGRNQMAFGWK